MKILKLEILIEDYYIDYVIKTIDMLIKYVNARLVNWHMIHI